MGEFVVAIVIGAWFTLAAFLCYRQLKKDFKDLPRE